MSGHSKFATIKRKKAKIDGQRGKIFTKIGKEIAVAVNLGGTDPSTNSRLRDSLAKARANNMPNENIERSIKKASGDLNPSLYEEIIYEGYGPNGIAIIVSTLTDNRNRTASNVRSHFTKGDGNMGTLGCVSFMFDKKGLILIEKDDSKNEDELIENLMNLDIEDIITQNEGYEILTSSENFYKVNKKYQK